MNIQYHGLYGGAFDPIHNGHLAVAQSVLEQCDLAGVDFLPTYAPPHRRPPYANFDHRLAMTERALVDYPYFHCNGCEAQLSRPSFTYNTIDYLQTSQPHKRFCLIVGIDAFLQFDRWYRWQEIASRIVIIVMTRAGYTPPPHYPQWWQQARLERLPNDDARCSGIIELCVPAITTSSSNARNKINAALDVLDEIPTSVYHYITQHNLYNQSLSQ